MKRIFSIFASLLIAVTISGVCSAEQTVIQQPNLQQNQQQNLQVPAQVTPGTNVNVPAGTNINVQPSGVGAGPQPVFTPGVSSVTTDANWVYVIRGDELLKINKDTMQVEGTTQLPQSQAAVIGAGPSACGPCPTTNSPCPPACAPGTYTGCPVGGCATACISCNPAATPSAAMQAVLAPRSCVQTMINDFCGMNSCDVERNFMQIVIQANNAGSAWSDLVADRAVHRQLRSFARRELDENGDITGKYGAMLHDWYNTTGYDSVMPVDANVSAALNCYRGRDFEIQYMQAMITHYSELLALTNAALPKMTHCELKTTAANLGAEYCKKIQILRNWLCTWYGIS